MRPSHAASGIRMAGTMHAPARRLGDMHLYEPRLLPLPLRDLLVQRRRLPAVVHAAAADALLLIAGMHRPLVLRRH